MIARGDGTVARRLGRITLATNGGVGKSIVLRIVAQIVVRTWPSGWRRCGDLPRRQWSIVVRTAFESEALQTWQTGFQSAEELVPASGVGAMVYWSLLAVCLRSRGVDDRIALVIELARDENIVHHGAVVETQEGQRVPVRENPVELPGVREGPFVQREAFEGREVNAAKVAGGVVAPVESAVDS